MIVMFLGDTHGNRGFTLSAIRYAAENGIDRIVQVGDFGFWPRINSGQTFLKDVAKESVKLNVPLYFIDGNHEDHLYLKSLRERERFNGGMVNYGSKYPVTYIDRGTRWEWDGTWFGAFGGAFSIDRRHRIEDSGKFGWFRDEVPDESKIEQLGQVDVLLTHDSPIVPPPFYESGHFIRDATSELCQVSVYRALVATQAKLLVHGHWHLNQRYNVADATIQGLAFDGTSLYAAAVVFDTKTRVLYRLKEWEYRDAN